MKLLTQCPTCKQKLVAKVLSCPDCGLEISNIFELSPFDYLDTANTDFLMCFLKSRGNLKAVQEALGISYPTAKKQLDRVITALGMANENVDDLKSAFDWCLMNNIRLVNLSFGTTHEYSRWFYISRPVIWKSLFRSAFVHTES